MPRYIKIFQNALPAEFCERLIAKFEADQNVQPDPQPDYSKRHFLNISVQKDWASINMELARYTDVLTKQYFALPEKYADAIPEDWFDDGYVLARYAKGDTCIFHADNQCATPPNNGLRLATQLFYLNTVESGGETFFPMQDVKIQPERGKAIMFPPGHTHPHEVLATGSTRYILQTWITDPDLVILKADEVDYGEESGIIYEE